MGRVTCAAVTREGPVVAVTVGPSDRLAGSHRQRFARNHASTSAIERQSTSL